jgi:crossover junction endodeoxyribonuclease RuvC
MDGERVFEQRPPRRLSSPPMIVLGIDPGTADTGYGVVTRDGGRLRALDYGVVSTPARRPLEQRLATIYDAVAELIERHVPGAVALEDLYVGANPRTILSVGHARGAVLAACGRAGLAAAGYPPAEVKQGVCGYGRADKRQVERMVCALLGLDARLPSDHAADALAVAVCHAQRSRAAATHLRLVAR